MIDTNLVRRSYRVTVMKELFHRLADEGHGTRLGYACPNCVQQLLVFGATLINLQQFRFSEHFSGKIYV